MEAWSVLKGGKFDNSYPAYNDNLAKLGADDSP